MKIIFWSGFYKVGLALTLVC